MANPNEELSEYSLGCLSLYHCMKIPTVLDSQQPLVLLFLVNLNKLIIDSKLPIRHWCHIKERNQSASFQCHLIKGEARSEDSTSCSLSSIFYLSAIWVWTMLTLPRLSCESVLCICLCLSLLSVCACLCCVYQRGLLCLYWTAQKASHGEGMRGTLQTF